ncbi:MAG: DUF1232 domain-containing protein, partial [Akkermansia sp.]|nr:DUF1232 domain-containing protein [Akkermansia sp.]
TNPHKQQLTIYTTMEDNNSFEKSKWVQQMTDILKNPQKLADFTKEVADYIAEKSKQGITPVIERAKLALEIFNSDNARKLLTTRNILLLGGALIYFLSPIDFIFDFIPGIGLLDDLGVLTMVLSIIIPPLLENPETPQDTKNNLSEEMKNIKAEEAAGNAPKGDSDFGSWIKRLASRLGL